MAKDERIEEKVVVYYISDTTLKCLNGVRRKEPYTSGFGEVPVRTRNGSRKLQLSKDAGEVSARNYQIWFPGERTEETDKEAVEALHQVLCKKLEEIDAERARYGAKVSSLSEIIDRSEDAIC